MHSFLGPYSSTDKPISSDYTIAAPDHVILAFSRKEKGITLQEVADQAKINIRQYQKFESGERNFHDCSFSLGLRICQILDIDPKHFI